MLETKVGSIRSWGVVGIAVSVDSEKFFYVSAPFIA
jgi:hypothetical protein